MFCFDIDLFYWIRNMFIYVDKIIFWVVLVICKIINKLNLVFEMGIIDWFVKNCLKEGWLVFVV